MTNKIKGDFPNTKSDFTYNNTNSTNVSKSTETKTYEDGKYNVTQNTTTTVKPNGDVDRYTKKEYYEK